MSNLAVLVASLVNFASYSSGFPVPKHLPMINIMPQCDLQNVFLKRPLSTPCPKDVMQIGAMYDFENNVLSFPEEIDPYSLQGRGILVHELVHFLQDAALENNNAAMQDLFNANLNCMNRAFEPMAYKAGLDYLRQNRVDPWVGLDISPSTIVVATYCGTDYSEF